MAILINSARLFTLANLQRIPVDYEEILTWRISTPNSGGISANLQMNNTEKRGARKKKMKKENKKKKLENLREPWKNRQESSSVMKVSAKKSAKTRTDLNTSRESQRIFTSPQWEGGEAEEGEKKKKFHRSPKESRTPNSSSLPPPSQKRIFNKEFQ